MKLPKHAEGRNFHNYYNTADTRRSSVRCNFCRNFTSYRLMVGREEDVWPMALCHDCYRLGHR